MPAFLGCNPDKDILTPITVIYWKYERIGTRTGKGNMCRISHFSVDRAAVIADAIKIAIEIGFAVTETYETNKIPPK